MAKVALLIGVSEYDDSLGALPGALKDVAAMRQVLEADEIGAFDRVQVLENPDPMLMQESIESLFALRDKQDLTVLFFSGHGLKDDYGRLYWATPQTRKNSRGDLVRSSAVPVSFIHDVMGNSRCKRQVIILDCCFSGAFAEGMRAKDDGRVDVQTQLGAEGRVVLTSSTSTQYSFEQQDEDLSVYTRYVVEGIQTGAADFDSDGLIAVDELHEYASQKVREAAPAMRPKIFAVEEGFRIFLAKAPIDDVRLRYRKEVEQFACQGTISQIGRYTLDALQGQFGLSADDAIGIESEVLKPYQVYQKHLQQYRQAYEQAIAKANPLSQQTQKELKRLQQVLSLEDADVIALSQEFSKLPKQSLQALASVVPQVQEKRGITGDTTPSTESSDSSVAEPLQGASVFQSAPQWMKQRWFVPGALALMALVGIPVVWWAVSGQQNVGTSSNRQTGSGEQVETSENSWNPLRGQNSNLQLPEGYEYDADAGTFFSNEGAVGTFSVTPAQGTQAAAWTTPIPPTVDGSINWFPAPTSASYQGYQSHVNTSGLSGFVDPTQPLQQDYCQNAQVSCSAWYGNQYSPTLFVGYTVVKQQDDQIMKLSMYRPFNFDPSAYNNPQAAQENYQMAQGYLDEVDFILSNLE